MACSRTSTYPSFDIASGAPAGQGATNELLLTWTDARARLNHEHALLEDSTDGERTFSAPVAISQAGDRANQPAIAITQDGAQSRRYARLLSQAVVLLGLQQRINRGSAARLAGGGCVPTARIMIMSAAFSIRHVLPEG